MTTAGHPARRRALFLAKLALTLVLLYAVWLLVRDSLDDVGGALRSVSWPLLALALANHFVGRYLMGWQTSLGLAFHGLHYGPVRLFAINLKTLFFGFFLPGDLAGSAVKWHLISRIDGKRAETFATVVYIRLSNLAVVLATGLGALLVKWPFDDRAPLAVGAIALAAVIGAVLALHFPWGLRLWTAFTARAGRIFGGHRIRSAGDRLVGAFDVYRQQPLRDVLVLWGFSLLIKLSITLSFWLVARAMGLDITFLTLLWIHSAVEIVQFIPITFSGIGTREISLIYLFQLFGHPEAIGLTFALLLLFLRLVLVGAGGALAAAALLRGSPPRD